MRFTNKNEVKIIPSIYIVLVAVFVTNIFVNIEIMASDTEQEISFSHFIPNIVTLLLGLYVHRIGQAFDFDSDGETLNFKNNGVFLSKFMEYRVKKAEFPKRKLGKFKFVDFGIYSALTIYIRSRRKKGYRKYTFNTTFLTRKKKRGMVDSLNKVLETTPKVTA
ncbi:hypothetical protein [Christiangramia forsetii]|uniref:Membrane protein n=2 Tax=Christiangramia forsetii TaxID=411153 RepID=A0M1F8_CHRFK|nr:hypothetical protein [Christiangramia forsetii]GGG42617.1 hypothetical protein GCM10011532_28100 [Christiangramia forsetii]CAL66453.1 membrane protein [Christiangramia forsetii KT0803]